MSNNTELAFNQKAALRNLFNNGFIGLNTPLSTLQKIADDLPTNKQGFITLSQLDKFKKTLNQTKTER